MPPQPSRFAVAVCLATIAALSLCAGSAQAAISWERAWGKDVVMSGTNENYEVCAEAADCQFGNFGNQGGEFQSVSAVAADPSGNVYVVDPVNHRVSKFDSSGNFVFTWGKAVADGVGFETCADRPNCANGQTGAFGGEMSSPMGVAADGQGFVYVADFGNKRIQKFNVSGVSVAFVEAWGNAVAGGSGYEVCSTAATCVAGANSNGPGGELSGPSSVAVNEAGEVYVGDETANRVQMFDSSGTFLVAFGKSVLTVGGGGPAERCTVRLNCKNGTAGTAGGEFSAPKGVAADAADVYVADQGNERVQRFDPGGTFITAWGKDVKIGGGNLCTVDTQCQAGTPGSLGGELNGPHAVATDFAGNAYVADQNNDRIQKFDSSGAWQLTWGKGVAGGAAFEVCTVAAGCATGAPGGLGGEIDGPNGLASDGAGHVYLSDGNNNRIQKFLDRPAPPALTGTSPAAPANHNAPRIQGTAPAGSTVRIYTDNACTGSPVSDTAANLTSAGIAVTVPDDSTTTFFATATDAGNITSACSSSSVTYVEDSTPPDTIVDTAPSGTISMTTPTFTFHASEPSATFECRFDGQPFVLCSGPPGTHAPLFPLADGTHTFEVRAIDPVGNPDATPAQASFTVNTAQQKPLELPPPVQGRLVNAIPEKGTVLVKLPAGAAGKAHAAATGFVPLETVGRQLPVGSTLDTKKGTVLLTAATNASGGTQDGHFSKGLFKFGQTKKNPLTTLSMTGGGLSSCSTLPRGGSRKVAAAKRKRRTLFSNVKGRFRTRGRNSTATVRGTKWTMTDTCSGTRTSVKTGSVTVRDFTLRKTRTVKAGHSYLARVPKAKRKRR
jgi:NHL repeat